MPTPIFSRARRAARRLAGRNSGTARTIGPAADATPSAAAEQQPVAAYRGATPSEIVELRAQLAAALELRAREQKREPG